MKEKVVKTTLNGLFKKRLKYRKPLRSYIENYVVEASKILYEGIRLYTLFILESLEQDILPENFYEKNFIAQFLQVVNGSSITNKYISAFCENNNFHSSIKVDTNVLLYFSNKYSTCLTNTFFMSFSKRQYRYVSLWCENNGVKEPPHLICNQINGISQNRSNKKVLKFISDERNVLGEPSKINEFWLREKKNHGTVLKYFYHILKYTEEYEDVKLFTLVPSLKIGCRYMDIDTRILYYILNSFKKDVEPKFDLLTKSSLTSAVKFRANKEKSWSLLFNMKLLTKSSYHIETDGFGVSIHYKTGKPLDKKSKKWKPAVKDEDVKFHKSYSEGRRVIGVDPGRINTISTAEVLPDGTVETLTVTKKQYYQECGINVLKRKSATWKKEIEPFEEIFAQTSPKTSSYETYEKHTDDYDNVREELWEAKTQRKIRRERFRSYVLKQKFLDRLANKLIGPDKNNPPILAYGDAKFNAIGKFESSPGPTTWIAKGLAQ